jgi:hypothetical protein
MNAMKARRKARKDRKTQVQERLQQAGALHSKCSKLKDRDGSTKAVDSPKHSAFMRGMYGDAIPKDYRQWKGKNDLPLAWAAGIIDGEGYVGAYWARFSPSLTRNPSAILKVSISQNHLPTLVRLQEVLQVHGRIRPAPKTVKYRRPVFYLTYENRHALEVMRRVMPYLVRKRPNVHLCEALYAKGCIGVKPGPDGHPLSVWTLRVAIIKALSDLK